MTLPVVISDASAAGRAALPLLLLVLLAGTAPRRTRTSANVVFALSACS
jgi:hypothetical protein